MTSDTAVEVTLYERPGCHLCEAVAPALESLTREAGARLTRVNVETSAALEERYGLLIPVVEIDQVEVARAPIDIALVRAALTRATVGR